MILTSTKPFTIEEIEKLKETYPSYIKTVIDVEKEVCAAGMEWHFEGEQLLLEQGSSQSTLWGGGVDVKTKEIDFNSFINVRSRDNNSKNEIQSEKLKATYKKLTEYFFEVFL